MNILDYILLCIGTIIIPGILYSFVLLAVGGAFSKKNKEINENEFKEKEKKKTKNWKFDPTNLSASDLDFLLHIAPYIYRYASDEEKKKMDEILKRKDEGNI